MSAVESISPGTEPLSARPSPESVGRWTSWSGSDRLDEIIPAFVGALGELEDVTRSKTADAGPYSYRYAELGNILAHARGVLAGHDLAVSQVPTVLNREVFVTTTVFHRSGQWLTFDPLILPAGQTAQQTGSAITYARRYSLMAVLGLATEDDDGAGAAPRSAPSASSGPSSERRTLTSNVIKAVRDRQTAEDLTVDDLAAIVELATDGRTTNLDEVFADELPRLRVSFDNYLVRRLTSSGDATPGVSHSPGVGSESPETRLQQGESGSEGSGGES